MKIGDTARKEIIKARSQLLTKYPFFGYLSLGFELKEVKDRESTMATDGNNLFYNPEFVKKISQPHLITIIAQEVLHCGLGHIWRRGERVSDKWNIACDHAANLILKDEGFTFPKDHLADSRFKNMSVEAIYELIPDNPSQKLLLDDHSPWYKNDKDKDKEQRKDQGQGKNSNNQDSNESNSNNKLSEDQKEQASDNSSQGGEDLKKNWEEKMARAAIIAKLQGHAPGVVDKIVEDILEPKIDWPGILKETVMSTVKKDFRLIPPLKKHLWRKIYLPSTYGEGEIEIAVAIDTSGSVSDREFQEFMAEIRGITEQFTEYKLYLFLCDAKIHNSYIITHLDKWPTKLPKAGGGTDFTPVFKMIENQKLSISTLVYLTDGEGTFPSLSPHYPVIWLLNKENINVPWGRKIIMQRK